ncbi:MAG TPA: RNA 3'-terminal phosphate cyclase [Thermoplasmata archaeon]|nr:RNA 3'-terminal phosphate cyclase [Thermoplasmata archaeon]
MLEIDGSHGEGGGQLLRMAAALAALKSVPVRIVRIRAKRRSPGLAAQHVAALRAVAALCKGTIDGLELGSAEITFRPGPIEGGQHTFDVGTAGSVTLVLQAALPVAAAAPRTVRLRVVGGTDVRWSPPVDYFTRVFLPLLGHIGGRVDVELLRRGYYPRGGGEVEAVIDAAQEWAPLDAVESSTVEAVRGIAHVSNLPEAIPTRMKHAALRRLHGIANVKVEERVYSGQGAIGQGGATVLWAQLGSTILGATSLAERGKTSERVGEEAAAELRTVIESGATLDVHAADQLLPYLARARGPSHFLVQQVSGHLDTMAWLVPQFFPCKIRVSSVGGLEKVSVEPER